MSFLTVLSVDEVVARLLVAPPLAARAQTVPLAEAELRVLATDVHSSCDVPPADRAGMDGYALQAADTFGAGESNPVWLDCVGHVNIEQPANFCVQSGQCAGIVTGAHMPEGTDAVVMVEYTKEFGADMVEFRRSVAPGEYVMLRGEDATRGRSALAPKTLLRAQEIGLLAATGHTLATVFPRPSVHILSTGDELVPVDAAPVLGQIRDVNSHALACMARAAGAEPHLCGIVPDKLEALVAALHLSLKDNPDVIMLSGGSSVGTRDLTLNALQALRIPCEVFCHGVALSPGKPLILAKVERPDGHTYIWGLPGQVASAQVVMTVLGAPFLRHLAGHTHSFDQSRWPSRRAVLSRNMASRQGREDYVRVRLDWSTIPNALPTAVPVTGLSGLLRTLINAHGLLRIPADLEGIEAGREVEILLI